jgi:hypothetical protein
MSTESAASTLTLYLQQGPALLKDRRNSGMTEEELLKSVTLHEIVGAMKNLPMDGSDKTVDAAKFLGDLYMKKFDMIVSPYIATAEDMPSHITHDRRGAAQIQNHVNASATSLHRTFVERTVDYVTTGIGTNKKWWRDQHMPTLDAYTAQVEPRPKEQSFLKKLLGPLFS